MEILNTRASGVLLHITSLPTEFGIGDLGSAALGFTDYLKKAGQQYWQILPFNPTGASNNYSPYACYSAFAGNPLLISPVLLYEDGLLKKVQLNEKGTAGVDYMYVDYKRVSAAKNKLFNLACNNFRENTCSLRDDFTSFCIENDTKWLDDFACFAAFKKYFKQRFNMTSWSMWPRPIRDRSTRDVKELGKILCKEVEKQKFLQFLFFRQWKNLKRYANANGVKIFGDVPIYVGHESSDVWSHPCIFKLDSKKMPAFIAGVPPDYYSKTGQIWKSPVYNWRELKKTGFSWWIDRMKFNFDMFDLVRLDHFRGFIAYWEVPAAEKTAVSGRWVRACPEEFFNLLSEKSGILPIVAENLGIITPDVTAVMEKFGFPGIRVLQFAFGKDFPGSSYLPHNYIKNTVACTGTHDNNTLRGWLENEAGSFEISNLIKYLNQSALPGQEGVAASVAASTETMGMAASMAASAAALVSASETAANNPSEETGNTSAEVKYNINESKASGPDNTVGKDNPDLAGMFELIISKIITLLMASAANLVIIPMQDILGLGQKARMNRPSTRRGNWKWQMNQSMLSDSTAKKLSALTGNYKRNERDK